jgi:hypothetical protein
VGVVDGSLKPSCKLNWTRWILAVSRGEVPRENIVQRNKRTNDYSSTSGKPQDRGSRNSRDSLKGLCNLILVYLHAFGLVLFLNNTDKYFSIFKI